MWALIIEFSDNPNCVFVCKLWNELSRKPRINKGYYPNGKHHIYEKMGNLENCELSTRGLHGFSVYDGKWTQYNHGVIKARFDGIYRPDPIDPDEQPFYPDLEPPPK